MCFFKNCRGKSKAFPRLVLVTKLILRLIANIKKLLDEAIEVCCKKGTEVHGDSIASEIRPRGGDNTLMKRGIAVSSIVRTSGERRETHKERLSQ